MLRSPQPDTRVLEALQRIGALPVLGGTVARIRTLAEDPHGTTADLVAVAATERIAREAPTGAARAALERRRLGMDHAAAGAMLVGLSDPHDDVMQAIAFHHGGPNGDASPSGEAACVQIGNAIAHMLAE